MADIPRIEFKDSNPKDSVGIKKVSMSMVPAIPLAELGIALGEGALKYGRHNYRGIGVRGSVYYDAAMRHLMAWWEGEDIDPESSLSHITKVMSCMVVLRDGMIQGNWVDDRPPKSPQGWVNELNQKMAGLIQIFPNPPPALVEKKNPDPICK